MLDGDFYKTITAPSEGLYKDKGSKFIARAYPVRDVKEVQEYLLGLKREFHDARHFCYAYNIDPENVIFKSSDDGEPAGTAGKPILNQILSFGLCDVLVVVIRYFGGTKLGVSGLIKAYKSATIEALNAAKIVTGKITREINISFDYPLTNDVMKVIHECEIEIVDRNFAKNCRWTLVVQKNQKEKIMSRFDNIYGVFVK
jgi:uncharacterized YigZ family protein